MKRNRQLPQKQKKTYYRNAFVAAQKWIRSSSATYCYPSHLHTVDLHQIVYVFAHLSSRFIEVDSINFI